MPYNDQFCIPEGRYFLSHSVGCLPVAAQQYMQSAFIEPWATKGGDAWPDWLDTIEVFCSELASLFSVTATDICPQPSVSAGFSNYLTSLPQQNTRKRHKVLMHADAFPTMGFVVAALKQRGFDLVLIDEAADDPAVWQRHLAPDVLAAVITHVHSNTGVVSPVADIATQCRAAGVYSIVDVAQSAGIITVNPTEWRVDALVGSCVKWLCGGPGAGYLWVDPEHVQDLSPEHVGWFSHEHPFEFDIQSFRAVKTARKFWGGTPSIAPYALALGSLKTLREIGYDTLQAHNLDLKKAALKGLAANQLMQRPPEAVGGTLCLEFDQQNIETVARRLKEENSHFDQRGNTVRLSFHLYNCTADADAVNAVLKSVF